MKEKQREIRTLFLFLTLNVFLKSIFYFSIITYYFLSECRDLISLYKVASLSVTQDYIQLVQSVTHYTVRTKRRQVVNVTRAELSENSSLQFLQFSKLHTITTIAPHIYIYK